MATTVKEVVKVKALSRYGFQIEDGSYVNWGKFVKEEDKGKVVPGGSYEMELYISDKGSKNVNKVGEQVGTIPVPSEATRVAQSAVTYEPKARPAASPVGRDFDKEARGKTRCALLEALLSNAAVDTTDMFKLFAVVDQGVSYVFGDTK